MSDIRRQAIIVGLELIRVEPDQVFELRALNVPTRYSKACKPFTVAGWFDDLAELASVAVDLEDRGALGIYVTLNPTKPALLGRANNHTIDYPNATTTDHDIVRRVWIPFDFDPVRPAQVSASDEEIEATKPRAIEAVKWINAELDAVPDVWAFSGNGFHALFRVNLPNDDKSKAFVENILKTTSDQFSDEVMSVDKTVFNAARIWKLYGTVARKGDSVPMLHRTHRRACLLGEWFTK